jgi:hypothetical protein
VASIRCLALRALAVACPALFQPRLKAVTGDQSQVAGKKRETTARNPSLVRIRIREVCLGSARLSLALLLLCSLFTVHCPLLLAQSTDATITGIVTDPTRAIIRGAKVALINIDTGVRYPAITNDSGIYTVSGQVGNYRIEVEHVGFKTVIAPGIVLHTQDVLEINFEMAVGSVSESVTVNAGATNDNPAVSMTVDREFVENMPLNGRSFQDLVQLAPGTVSSQNGYYSINGQRTDGNNYSVDGVSSNLGGINNQNTGTFIGSLNGVTPSQTALGTTQSLAAIDSLQEFTIQTSGYTAEFGRNPGGQVQFTTRSGANNIHGSLFEFLRNTAFDANSWQNNHDDIPQTAEHQNDFGGTIGGPLVIPRFYNGKDKSFYFFSYEGLRLLLPNFESEYTPTQAFRNWAASPVQPYLNASPLPSPDSPGNQDGCTVPDPTTGQPTACDALFNYGYSSPNSLDNIGLRIDQRLGRRLHAFLRYADTPSSIINGAENPEVVTINAHTWTFGFTANINSVLLDDFRFNYSHDGEGLTQSLAPIGGAVPVSRSLLIPATYDGPFAYGSYEAYASDYSWGIDYGVGNAIRTIQHQYQFVDSLAWTRGKHRVKFGGDWRRLTPTFSPSSYEGTIQDSSLADIQNGLASLVQVNATAPSQPVFDNLSLYAQDHWEITRGLNIDYGLRWEFNPPPGPSNGHYPVVLNSNNLTVAQLAPVGTPLYVTSYDHFAPRFGFAWNVIPAAKHALTVRGGFGIFFDTGQGSASNAYSSSYPFSASGPTLPEVPFPLSDAVLAPPSLNVPLTPPYPQLGGLSSSNLTLPYTEEWNLSLDEAINQKNTITVSYVGNNGRKLLFTQQYYGVPGNPAFPNFLSFTTNSSQSSYNALQIQEAGKVVNGLEIVASFTLGHALDNASGNNSLFVPQWGNSAYDLRRMLNVALNYQAPTVGSSRWMQMLTHGWLLANRFSTQSGYPLNILQTQAYLPNGSAVDYFPDLVPNVPIYLHGRAADLSNQLVPGKWRLNRAAFACTTTGATDGPCTGSPTRQGTLGRNYIRNPPFWVLNTALQRSFPIHEQLHLNFRAEAFNVFNHPSIGGPFEGLSASIFGELTGVTMIGSPNSLYSMGSARSLQFSLKLQF